MPTGRAEPCPARASCSALERTSIRSKSDNVRIRCRTCHRQSFHWESGTSGKKAFRKARVLGLVRERRGNEATCARSGYSASKQVEGAGGSRREVGEVVRPTVAPGGSSSALKLEHGPSESSDVIWGILWHCRIGGIRASCRAPSGPIGQPHPPTHGHLGSTSPSARPPGH